MKYECISIKAPPLRVHMQCLPALIHLVPPNLRILLFQFLLSICLTHVLQFLLLELLPEDVLLNMEILAGLGFDLLLSLLLKLDQLCSLEVACHLVVLLGEDLALMGIEFVSFGLAFEFGLKFVDLRLL